MPIYEFQCRECRRKTTKLLLARDRIEDVRCQHCGSDALVKLFSRFATLRSDESRAESLAEAGAFGDLDETDPKSVARFMKHMGKEMGDDFGEEIEAAITQEGGGGPDEPGEGPADELPPDPGPDD